MSIDWKLLFGLFLKTFISFNSNDLRYIVDSVESTIGDYIYKQDLAGILVTDEEVKEIRAAAKDALYAMFERDLLEGDETT